MEIIIIRRQNVLVVMKMIITEQQTLIIKLHNSQLIVRPATVRLFGFPQHLTTMDYIFRYTQENTKVNGIFVQTVTITH